MVTAEQSSATDNILSELVREPGARAVTGVTENDGVVTWSRMDADALNAMVRRHGCFVHELRNHLGTAMLWFGVMKAERTVSQRTLDVLERSLRGLRDLIDRSASELRLASGTYQKERLRLATLMDEIEIDSSIDAANRGLQFSVERADSTVLVDVDRQLFASAIANLLQNAFKFTRPSSHVWLRTHSRADRVSIEVEDECGGLPPGAAEVIFRPFEQRGPNRTGLGLGLAISRQVIEDSGGTLRVRDIPGKGCNFIVDIPMAVGGLSLGGH